MGYRTRTMKKRHAFLKRAPPSRQAQGFGLIRLGYRVVLDSIDPIDKVRDGRTS